MERQMGKAMTCPRQARCATYTWPVRHCDCARSKRDEQVLALLMIGAPMGQIKKELRICREALSMAWKRLFKKHGVKNRQQLMVKVYQTTLPRGA